MSARLSLAALVAAVATALPARALPTMIRLSYSDCSTCHYTPQGAGLLTEYGKSVDEAQSARAGEYAGPSETTLAKVLTVNHRVEHDVRVQFQEKADMANGNPAFGHLLRATYRNVTPVGERSRFELTAGAELPAASPIPNNGYLPKVATNHPFFLGRALWSFRPSDGMELTVGRDYLPVGVNGSDPTLFVRVRNRNSLYDLPVQVKGFWWSDKFMFNPYLFGPTFQETAATDREYGAGVLGERVIGNGAFVLGLNMLAAKSQAVARQEISAHARLGFGRWGILSEYAYTYRKADTFDLHQHASFVQLFLAAQEWAVISLTGQHLLVSRPFAEQQVRLRPEITLRITPNITAGLNVTESYDLAKRTLGTAVGLTINLKTVN
ncbi:MAG: hypothetical protein ACT4TC_13625 [Myxococcaceae bacterium]